MEKLECTLPLPPYFTEGKVYQIHTGTYKVAALTLDKGVTGDECVVTDDRGRNHYLGGTFLKQRFKLL